MDSVKEAFCITADKELLLQLLKINNVPSIELVNPETGSYPLIGRLFGHHSGKDITIINTKEKTKYGEFDYFTKLYVIEKEYCFEVEALRLDKVQVAEEEHLILNGVPIRTKEFGWGWKDIDTGSVPEEWADIAIRALYVTGLTTGFVKLGILTNNQAIVTDINTSKKSYKEQEVKQRLSFTMGADVEFMLSCDDEFLPSSTFFPLFGDVGCDERQIEQDSGEFALVEIRPDKADAPKELFNNVKILIEKASNMVPYENIKFHGGSMPFTGYQCGGHIHFGIPLSLSLLRALDQYLALPVAMIEEPRTARLRRKTKHGGLGRFRIKSYGFEYLSLSSWIVEPELTLSILCLAQLVARHYQELEVDFLFHPLIQRAYYQGNQMILKSFWKGLKERIVKTSSYLEYEGELAYLFESIEKGSKVAESTDIRENWGLTTAKNVYDPGLIIQIPKRQRQKYKLCEGQLTKIYVGKNVSSAVIKPYPFSFLQSNSVHLTKSLRKKLNLPKDWNPKILSINNVLVLGPIVGILARRPFERQTTYFQHLSRLAKEKQMLVYVFEPQDIIWDQMLIRGATNDGEGLFPFPAVIYDRYFTDGVRSVVDIDEIRTKLQIAHHIPFINPPNLMAITNDKWKSHQFLINECEGILPESRLFQNPSDIVEMLDHYGEIFLKPIGGSMSIGIIHIIRRPSGIQLMHSGQKMLQNINNMDELLTVLTPLMKYDYYIVQEGIRRKQYKDKNVEIRVYLQKNEKHTWLRTGMVARLTDMCVLTDETETNLRISTVLKYLYPEGFERRQMYNNLAKVSKRIVETLEEEVGTFGEIAVDLCIDQYDAVKLLEINAKPDNLFSQIRAYKLRNLAGIRLLNYATSLAGFENDDI